jgi:hypothetical protein
MTPEDKKELSEFFGKFWTYKPQQCFPQVVAEMEEQGINIRIFPNKRRFKEIASENQPCPGCGKRYTTAEELGFPNYVFVNAEGEKI